MSLRSRLALTVILLVLPVAIAFSLLQNFLRMRTFDHGMIEELVQATERSGQENCEADPAQWPAPPRLDRRRGPQCEPGEDCFVPPVPGAPPWHEGGPPPPLHEWSRRNETPAGDAGWVRREDQGRPGEARRARRDQVHDQRRRARIRDLRSRRFRERAMLAYGSDFEPARPGGPVLADRLRDAMRSGDDTAAATITFGDQRARAVVYRTGWEGPCAYVLHARIMPAGATVLGTPILMGGLTSLVAALLAWIAGGRVVRRVKALERAVDATSADPARSVHIDGDDEIAQLAAGFERNRATIAAQITELNQRDTALREYIINTGHDLLTPLTVLQGHLAELSQTHNAAARAADECDYITSIVRNLNAVARLESSELTHRDEVDLNRLIVSVEQRHQPLAARHGVSLNYGMAEDAVCVSADATLLERAIGNLVHNAVVYNREGGHVAVTVEHTETGFLLRVADDGPGVSAGELARLVERGFRGDEAREARPAGRGFGLSIAHRIAVAHGWQLRLRAGEGGGLVAEISGEVATGSE